MIQKPHITETASVASGVLQIDFHVTVADRVVQCVFWKPDAAQPSRTLIALGHGGSQHKKSANILDLAIRYASRFGWCSLAIDAPNHGERTTPEQAEAERRNTERRVLGDTNAPSLRPSEKIAFLDALAAQAVPEWQATLDATLTSIAPAIVSIGYWGVSQGTWIGVPLLAEEKRVQCAVLGLADLHPDHHAFRDAAERIRIPLRIDVSEDARALPSTDNAVDVVTGFALALFPAARYREFICEAWRGTKDKVVYVGKPTPDLHRRLPRSGSPCEQSRVHGSWPESLRRSWRNVGRSAARLISRQPFPTEGLMNNTQMNLGQERNGSGPSSVWRVGDTIRREAGAWTPQVHRLLARLHTQGVTCVPAPLGMDDAGREVLTYLPGEVGSSPLAEPHRGDAVIVQAARLLRAIHDATVEVAAQWAVGWRAPVRAPVEVICHGDFAPYNCVFVGDELTGLFDFDFAHAGPRLWDIAYALYRFAPMADTAQTEGFGSPGEQARRVRLFCDAYGLEDRSTVCENVLLRIQFMVDFLLEGQALGDVRRIANIVAGHLRVYQLDFAYVKRHRALYEAALV